MFELDRSSSLDISAIKIPENCSVLTHYLPAMLFGKNFFFRGSFKFSIVLIQKISFLWKLEI